MTQPHKTNNLVIIPTYNEKENIESIIRYVFNLDEKFDILIIDDRKIIAKSTHDIPNDQK